MSRYPIYIPSKNRSDNCLTAGRLNKDKTPYHLVVEPQEEVVYRKAFPDASILVLDRNDGGLFYVRNWIKAHSLANGDKRHWQIDDNITYFRRWYKTRRIPINAGTALRIVADFVDRYENVAIAGLDYKMFCIKSPVEQKPFILNCHVYSCTLVLNSLPHSWRDYNDDVDICLQVLADGWCTILMKAFMIDKMWTMSVKGGMTATYQNDGRLQMARQLERRWPKVVSVNRRFQRPQHVVKDSWKRFDNKLIRRKDIDFNTFTPDEQGLTLKQVAPMIKAQAIRDLLK